MTPPALFAYPAGPHAPAHAPAGYEDYKSFKPWLRDDFGFCCAYCLTRERWNPDGHTGFGIDHLVAKVTAPTLTVRYANLVYSCNVCNPLKRVDAISIDPLYDGLGGHLAVDKAGVAVALTAAGRDIIDKFELNRPSRIRHREDRLALVRLKQALPDNPEVEHLFRRAFGYPDDLPDLTLLRPPGGNANPGSEEQSHHARRRRGELPDVY